MAKRKKTKTKHKGRPSRLETKIVRLEIQRDKLLTELEEAKLLNLTEAFGYLVEAVKLTLRLRPDSWEVVGYLVMIFISEIKANTGIDLNNFINMEDVFEIMGFDQVSAMSISNVSTIFEKMVKMFSEGKSEKEVIDFVKKVWGKKSNNE